MNDSPSIAKSISHDLRRCWKSVVAVDATYKLLAYILLVPLVGILLRTLLSLSGESFLADTDILFFLLGPVGWICVFSAGALWLGIVALEQSALLSIFHGDRQARPIHVIEALQFTAIKVPAVLGITARIVAILVMAALPFLAAGGLIYVTLLTEFDINYYLTEKPPSFWIAVALGGCLAAIFLGIAIRLLTGWVYALPLVLFESVPPSKALRASSQRAVGNRRIVAGWLVGWGLVNFGVVLLTNAVVGLLVSVLVPYDSDSLVWILFVLGLLLLLSAAVNLAGNLLVTILLASLVWNLYAKFASSGQITPTTELDHLSASRLLPFALTRTRLVLAVVIGLLLATTVGALSVRGVPMQDRAEVTAHRGASAAAPENTLAAVRQAIADGADWVEIDVQETADGQVVVFHDSDLKKAAGVDLKIWDATLDDLRDIDIGSRFGPEFSGERVPLLSEVLETCKDKVGVNIELKYYGHDQQLESRVAELVEAQAMESQIVLMSLEREAVLKMKALRPDWKVGLLAAVTIGDATRFEADFLAVNVGLAQPDLIRSAHRRGKQVHVWTVNDAVTMSSMMSRGVDNVITDEPALARSVLKQRASMGAVERLFIALAGAMAPPREADAGDP